MKWWPGWGGRERWINLATVILMFASLFNYYYIKFDFKTKNIFIVLVLAVCHFFILGGISSILYFVVYLIIVCLRADFQKECLHYIFKWFAWLMIPSIIVYFFVQAGVMPSFGTLNVIADEIDQSYLATEYTTRSNYIFYCYSSYYGIRFNGLFIEAGHLGMMVSFLLFADGFDLRKKETWILLGTIMMTMSLAGIILTFFGFLFMKYEQNEIKFSFIIIFGLSVLLLYLVGTFYNGGDNLINEWVLSRLEYDEEKGFSGNNRVFGMIDLYYAAMFNDTHTMLFGYDEETIEYLAWNHSRGTGYVMCMVRYGIIGTVAGVFFYFLYSFSQSNRRTAIVFLLFVLLMYWQRTYSFWFSWVICFVFGMSNRNMRSYENRYFNISS